MAPGQGQSFPFWAVSKRPSAWESKTWYWKLEEIIETILLLENQAQSWNMHILNKNRDGTESLGAPEMGERLIKSTGAAETRE